MNDDRFFDQLRTAAEDLRYEPSDRATFNRMSARIAERVERGPDLFVVLSGWFRPVTALLGVAVLVGISLLNWTQNSNVETIDSVAELQLLQEDLYSVLQ
jgi:hypothetical protein